MKIPIQKFIFVFLILPAYLFMPGIAGEINITVYNQNLGLVKDKRQVELKKGIQELNMDDVAARIDPTSVHFRSVTHPNSCFVLEQNFEYDLISREKLLQKYIGKEIELERRTGRYGEKTETIKGELLATSGGTILKSGEKILINPSGEIALPSLPGGLIMKPTLSWILQNETPGLHTIEVAYLTDGIKWTADYVIVTDAKDEFMDLTGWVTIDNNSGATYENARLKLVAGDINRVSPPGTAAPARLDYARVQKAAAPQFEEKSFFEYHLYTLTRKTTVKDNETKQIEFVASADVPVRKMFVYDGSSQKFYGYNEWSRANRNYGIQTQKKVYVMLEFLNTKKNNLGIPLPKGRIRVYKEDTDKSLEFIGEDNIEHTPKDEPVRIYLGDAFDVVGERVQTDFSIDTGSKWIKETIKITLKNHKESPVTVRAVEKLYRWSNWKINKKTADYEKLDSKTIEFKLDIPANSEKVAEYTVHYWWD